MRHLSGTTRIQIIMIIINSDYDDSNNKKEVSIRMWRTGMWSGGANSRYQFCHPLKCRSYIY